MTVIAGLFKTCFSPRWSWLLNFFIPFLSLFFLRGGQHQVAPGGPGPLSPSSGGGEDVKSNVFNRFRDIKDRAAVSKSNFSKIFSKKWEGL